MTPGYRPGLVSRSLVAPGDLAPGAAFLVPALVAPGTASWWHVARLVPLADEDGQVDRVRVVLDEADRRGRPYRVDLFTADRVVWASTLAPAALAVVRLGHRVACPTCRRPWGYLPVTVCNAVCFVCADAGRVGI